MKYLQFELLVGRREDGTHLYFAASSGRAIAYFATL